MQMNDTQKTLVKCFQELMKTLPRAPEIEAIYPEEPPEDDRELCVQLAEKLPAVRVPVPRSTSRMFSLTQRT